MADKRNDTCVGCGVNPGVWECASCREVPLCEPCVKLYQEKNWAGHGCFCVEPKHKLSLIADDDAEYQCCDYEDDPLYSGAWMSWGSAGNN